MTCFGLAFVIEPPTKVWPIGYSDSEIKIPQAIKQRNWGGGSCVHASMMVLFRWQGHPEIAKMWGQKYSGGERWWGLEDKLRKEKIPFASTVGRYDVGFLERAISTRRGCIAVVTVYEPGDHMVTLTELTDTQVGYVDSNDVSRVIHMPRDQFLEMWRTAGSWACTPMFAPPPPLSHKRFMRL